jgi:uncharacterized repeat protein (TIGR01451 family)
VFAENIRKEITMFHAFIRIVITGLATVAGAAAFAAVTLVHTVEKVERVTAQDGTVTTELVAADKVIPGDELHYTISFSNDGDAVVDPGTIVITNPLPAELEYIGGSAFGAGTTITYSVDGTAFGAPETLKITVDGVEVVAPASAYTAIRWTFGPALDPGAKSYVSFNARLE